MLYFPVWLLYAAVGLLGLILGSYLNSWMWRVHEAKEQWGRRSQCVGCSRQLAWSENIPLISFVVLRGQCRTCKTAIPRDYFLVEFATPLLLLAVSWLHLQSGNLNPWLLWRDIFFTIVLIVIFVYDYNYQLIMSGVVWAGTVVGFLINYFVINQSLVSLLVGLFVGGGFFLLQYVVSKGRWIGGGDVRLGVMMGVLLGWPTIVVALFIAYILGALVGIILLLFKKKGMQSAIPFGTFLAVGTWLSLFFGPTTIAWYMHLIR